MKSNLRIRLAAVSLLAPLAAAVVALPVAAQHRAIVAPSVAVAPVPGPYVERFVGRSDGPLQPGTEVRFRLRGAPGGKAWIDVPGSLYHVDMPEVRPGVYELHYVMTRRDDPAMFDRAVSNLRLGRGHTITRVDFRERDALQGDRVARDTTPPQITDVGPDAGERVYGWRSRNIMARFTDEGSGVDPASVRLLVDGRDVTRDTNVDGDGLRYREDLARGRHTAELIVGDRAGNMMRKRWTFEVGGGGGDGYGYGYGRGYDGGYNR